MLASDNDLAAAVEHARLAGWKVYFDASTFSLILLVVLITKVSVIPTI